MQRKIGVASILLLLHLVSPSVTLSTSARLLLEPVDTVINGEESVVLNCAASRVPATGADLQPKISWKRDGKLMTMSGGGASILANGSLYLTPSSRGRDEEGQYQCVTTWPQLGSLLSRSAKLQSAWLAHFDEEPQESNIVVLGQTARFGCGSQGAPPPRVEWMKDDAPLRLDPVRMTALPSGTLEIRGVQVEDGGLYKCNVTNAERSLLSRAGRLSIGLLSGRKGEEMAPVFTVLPKSQIVTSGTGVLFECSTVGHPLPSISWLKDGITLNLNSSASGSEGQGARLQRIGHGNLFIGSVQEGDKGTYQCRAENSEDSVDVGATLAVQVPPKVEVLGGASLVYGQEKEDVDLACSVVGAPTPSIQWYKNADMISEGDYFQLDNNGLTLRILGLVSSDSGLYQCFATNPAGNAQAAVQLVVLKPGQAPPSTHGSSRIPGPSNAGLAAPRELQATGVTSQSVTLTWKAPQGRESVQGYAVYYKELDSDRERLLNITAPSERLEVHVQGLQSNKKYTFRVVAYNLRGFGESSRPIIASTPPPQESETPAAPGFLKAWPVSSTAVAVEWAPPAGQASTFSTDLKYKIYYTELPNGALAEVTTPAATGRRNRFLRTQVATASEALLEDLRVFTEYSIAVSAINRRGAEGPKSRPIRVMTLSEAPADTPHNFQAEAMSSTSIAASWEPPSPEFQNGVITGYKLKYKTRRGRGSAKAIVVTTDANVHTTSLTGLERATEYQVKIAALNVNGSGPFTEWLSTTTFAFDLAEDAVPGQPATLHARPGSSSITISWTPPRDAMVLVRGYTIGWGRGIPDVYTKLVDGKKRTFTLDGLQPKADYVISLRAYNQVGDGVPIYENVRTKEHQEEVAFPEEGNIPGGSDRRPNLSPPVGLRALTLSTNAIHLQWTDSTPASAPPTRFLPPEPFGSSGTPRGSYLYVVKWVPIDEETQSPRSSHATANTTESSLTIQGLTQNTLYEFSVKSMLRGTRQSSEWSLVAVNKTLAEESLEASPAPTEGTGNSGGMSGRNFGPQDVTLLALTNAVGISSVVVNWQPPPASSSSRSAEGEVRGYVIRYTTNPALSEWMEENTLDDVLTHQVYGLTPDTTYYFQLTAKYAPSSIGGIIRSSDPTPIKSVRTPPLRSQGQGHGQASTPNQAPKSNEVVLYALIALSLLFAIASFVLCLYYRQRGGGDTSSSASPHKHGSLTKKGRGGDKVELNPPDLWIHHDKMELKGVRARTRHDSSPLDAELTHAFGGAEEEKMPLQQQMGYSSLKKHQHGYALSSPSSYTSNEVKYPTLGKTAHYGSSIASESSNTSSQPQQPHTAESNTLSRRSGVMGVGGGLGMPGGANLKSFAVPLPPTLQNTGGGAPPQSRQFTASPVRRISTSNIPNIVDPMHYATPPNHLNRLGGGMGMNVNVGGGMNMGMGVGGDDGGGGGLQKAYSTEELSLEISNLEGLMKDLNAITANEFQC